MFSNKTKYSPSLVAALSKTAYGEKQTLHVKKEIIWLEWIHRRYQRTERSNITEWNSGMDALYEFVKLFLKIMQSPILLKTF